MPASALMNVMVGAARKAGRSLAERLRRGGAASGLNERPGQLRLRRRHPRRGNPAQGAVSAPVQATGSCSRERGEVEGADRTRRIHR